MKQTGTRAGVFFFNILIAILCAAAIAFHFFSPLWEVKVNYTLTKETLEKLLKESDDSADETEGTETDGTETDGTEKNDFSLNDIDFGEIIGEEGVLLKLSVKIQTMNILSSFTEKDPKAAVEKAIEENVNSVVDQLLPVIDSLAQNAARTVSKKSVREIVKEQIKNQLLAENPDADVSEERIQEFLDKAGFTNEYIDAETDKLIDALYEENATTDSVSETAVATVEDIFQKLKNSGEPEFATAELSEENKAEIRNTLSDALSNIADDDGNLDMENFTARLFLELLRSASGEKNSENNESDSSFAPSSGPMKTVSAETSGTEASSGASDMTADEEDVKEELKKEIKQLIMEKIPDKTAETIVLGMKITAGVLCFIFFTWAYLIIKMLVKMFTKNPAVKLKLPIWLGWLHYLVLVLLPMGAIALIKASPSFLVNLIGTQAIESANEALSLLTVSFTSSGLVAAIAAAALIVISIPYGILRRKLKRGR